MIRIKISFGIIISIIVLGVSGFFVLRHETYEIIGTTAPSDFFMVPT